MLPFRNERLGDGTHSLIVVASTHIVACLAFVVFAPKGIGGPHDHLCEASGGGAPNAHRRGLGAGEHTHLR